MRSFYSSLAISAPFYGYLKLLKLHRTERSCNKDVRSGNRTQNLLHEGRALTDCAILAPPNVYEVCTQVCTKAANCRLVYCRMINWNCCTPWLILTVEPIFSLQVNAPFNWWLNYPRTPVGSGKTFAYLSCMCSADSPSLAINQLIIQWLNFN